MNASVRFSELARSASEARKTTIRSVDLTRYLNPAADTPHSLEYAFHLLGDVRGKVVLDLGCGSGENLVPLSLKGAYVVGLDLSRDLIYLAIERLYRANVIDMPSMLVGSAYDTKLLSHSVDVVFCMSLLHHLDIERAKAEILRVLKPGGTLIVKEPIRFSRTMMKLRKFFPAKQDISECEYPLNERQIETLVEGFEIQAQRDFRTPLAALATKQRFLTSSIYRADCFLLARLPIAKYATIRVMKLKARG
jgi:SAM-dependent methyltransferase